MMRNRQAKEYAAWIAYKARKIDSGLIKRARETVRCAFCPCAAER